ncbi:MSMEG_1061 family FMN-dependent PPOX-type flavoprotein [Bradyrhizobium sp.]|uniref:MSMEG_1061 family FMN-dependent PPOX-type flavoprotein n=1 Tax=Bradyrhizobium sp. TaxID=376 RepID=UPI003BAF448D
MGQRFEEVIISRERLRELNKHPSHFVRNKEIDHLDDICRRFIAASPFVVIASRGRDGRLDVSPKGDPAGFVKVLDDKTLAIPDRLGNNRLDTFENLLTCPDVGLIFIIPGNGDTLRVSGKGQIVRDSALQDRLAVNSKPPNLVLVITVEEAFLHCPKCIIRSRLWKPDQWPDLSDVPTLAEAMVAHGSLSESMTEVEAVIENSNTKRLY